MGEILYKFCLNIATLPSPAYSQCDAKTFIPALCMLIQEIFKSQWKEHHLVMYVPLSDSCTLNVLPSARADHSFVTPGVREPWLPTLVIDCLSSLLQQCLMCVRTSLHACADAFVQSTGNGLTHVK